MYEVRYDGRLTTNTCCPPDCATWDGEKWIDGSWSYKPVHQVPKVGACFGDLQREVA